MDTIRKPSTNEASIREKILFQPISLKSTVRDSSAYLTALSRTRIALSEAVKEEPPSPRCPSGDQEGPEAESEARVEVLRSLVHEAWTKADGNPADGKWGMIPRLLRLGVTSGRGARWVGTRTDRKAPDLEELGYFSAATEAEWHDWEKRIGVQEKVEGWKRGVQAVESSDLSHVDPPSVAAVATEQDVTSKGKTAKPPQPSGSQNPVPSSSHPNQGAAAAIPSTSKRSITPSAGPAIAQRNQGILKDKAPFGFSVVKRSQQVTATGKPSASSQPNSEAAVNEKHPEKASRPPSDGVQHVAEVHNRSSVPAPNDQRSNGIPKSEHHQGLGSKRVEQSKKPSSDIRNITDIPDLSFAPPSFPESQIITSTPIAQAKPPASSPSEAIPKSKTTALPLWLPSLHSSPKVTKTYGRSNNSIADNTDSTSASLPAIPTTSPKLPPMPISPSTPSKKIPSSSIGNLVTDRILTSPHFTPKKSKSAPPSAGETKQPLNANHKRPLDVDVEENEQQTKKARTSDRSGTPKQSDSQSRGVPPSPSTPISLKSRPTESNQAFSKTALVPPSSSPVTATNRQGGLPTLTELLASAKKAKANSVVVKPKPKPKPKHAPNPEARVQKASSSSKMKAKTKAGLRYVSPEPPRRESVIEDPCSLHPYELDLSQHPEHDILHDLDPGFDILSPAKSLSSIADSDSEVEEDELDEDPPKPNNTSSSSMSLSAFRPFATSTQKQPGLGLGSSPFTAGHPSSGSSSVMPAYNSQFSVARRVETVDRLLEKDLDLGIGGDADLEKEMSGWLRGPSLEKEMLDSP